MKKNILLFIALVVPTLLLAEAGQETNGYPIDPVPFTSVKVSENSFWGERLKASREVTIPLAFSKCEETGRYENFIRAAHPSREYEVGEFMGFPFDDTDVYKTIEGASYLLQTYPDERLEAYIDSVLNIVAAAQETDGYLYTARTINPSSPHPWSGKKRWQSVENGSHELYNLGHMVDAACAHYEATGKRNFLDIAIRYADCVCREIGQEKGQLVRVPGHQIAEMALAKLYLITGDKKYLDEAKFFLDHRGRTKVKSSYSQSHRPVVEQDEAVGHAVRAGYMYAGMADVAALTGDTDYIHAIDRIWQNIVEKKLYITGGVGSRHKDEAFGKNYELPNLTAYNETCAAIANVYVNYRLFLLHGESKYYDVLERTLYNGLISGMSLDGGLFFYPNPLESNGEYCFNADSTLVRQPWFGCACCPSNLCRFIPSLPGYVYAVRDKDVYVNLFVPNTSVIDVAGTNIRLTQQTLYPWDGDVDITIDENSAGQFTLLLRIPGWVRGEVVPSDLYEYSDDVKLQYSVTLNGQPIESTLRDGYFAIDRQWTAGDRVELHLDMAPRTVKANPHVEADRGRVAIERGPLVYCAEEADNSVDVLDVVLPPHPTFRVVDAPDLLGGIKQIDTPLGDATLRLVPYYAWNHRGAGKMEVWLKQE